MHTTNLDLSIEEMTKIEGAARLDIQIREGTVTRCQFAITEMQRFFEEAVRGKSIISLPHLMARICGTCSNAHLLASIASVENGLGITVSEQTMLLRKLLTYGLMIRDHGLHLYVFSLPDLFKRDSILAFDDHDPIEHELVHDCFAVKEAGNTLSIAAGGRSVHAPNVTIGGFTVFPKKEDLQALVPRLEEIRPRILRLIGVFLGHTFEVIQPIKYLALINDDYSFISGTLRTNDRETIPQDKFEENLVCTDIPYSGAMGCRFRNEIYMVGALSRLMLNEDALHPNTKRDAAEALDIFPSQNIFHNNLAQAVEMLHAVDASIDLISKYQGLDEKPLPISPKETTGIGIIEAPRGTLFHKVEINKEGKVVKSNVIVPTYQNQVGIEKSIRDYVGAHLDDYKEELTRAIEMIIRAYDPCMSCATHFLKIRWR
jgi:sulfhydrogenase subunit alpha